MNSRCPKCLYLVAICLVFLMYPSAGQETSENHIRGFSVGLKRCSHFNAHKDNENVVVAYKLWFGGYLTAVNYLMKNGKDILLGNDINYVIGWVDDYCARNPEKYMTEAASELIHELGKSH